MRGVVLPGLLQRHGPMASVLLASLLFGVFHSNAVQVIGATVGGCFYGWAFVRTRSLWVPILMHAGNNLFSELTHAWLNANGSSFPKPFPFPVLPSSQPAWLWKLMMVYLLLLGLGGLGWWLLITCLRKLERECCPPTPARPSRPMGEPQSDSPLTDFKARRAAPTSESG